jgi:hypothetical protein
MASGRARFHAALGAVGRLLVAMERL